MENIQKKNVYIYIYIYIYIYVYIRVARWPGGQMAGCLGGEVAAWPAALVAGWLGGPRRGPCGPWPFGGLRPPDDPNNN